MRAASKHLLFRDVDGLAFAAARGKLDRANVQTTYVPHQLGPILEFLHLRAEDRLPSLGNWLALNESAPLMAALEKPIESWISPGTQDTGFIRAVRNGPNADIRFTGFLMTAKRAGQLIAGFPAKISGQLVAAMEELENNIHDHAQSTDTGIAAFRAEPGVFEFVVADRGIGILRSLRRCKQYAELSDEGAAIREALTDGVSRFGPNGRQGYGFRPIFTGLANLRSELRFRSGDHAVTIDGTYPALSRARIVQKAPIDGFFASVRCHAAAEMSSITGPADRT